MNEAARLATNARRLFKELDQKLNECIALNFLAEVHFAKGETKQVCVIFKC